MKAQKNYKEEIERNYQTIAVCGDRLIVTFGDSFHPDVWDGSQSDTFIYHGDLYQIVMVDYHERLIECLTPPKFTKLVLV